VHHLHRCTRAALGELQMAYTERADNALWNSESASYRTTLVSSDMGLERQTPLHCFEIDLFLKALTHRRTYC